MAFPEIWKIWKGICDELIKNAKKFTFFWQPKKHGDYSRDFHQAQEYLKKDSEILENWFYNNYMVLNPRKCEFMGFGKTNENEVFTYHEIRLKKTTTKKLIGITIDKHLNFNEHLTNVCKRASRKLNSLSKVFLFLAINRKR